MYSLCSLQTYIMYLINYDVYITQITNLINNISSNEYTFKLCSIFHHFPWWLHGSEHPMYSLCSLQTYIMYYTFFNVNNLLSEQQYGLDHNIRRN